MKIIIFFLVIIIISFKILANGVGLFNISLWFYLTFLGIYLLIIFRLSKKRNNFQISNNYKLYLFYCLILLFIMIFVYFINYLLIEGFVIILQYFVMMGLSIMTYVSITNYKQVGIICNAIIIMVLLSAIIGIGQFFRIDLAFRINEIVLPFKSVITDGQRISGMSNTVITFSYELVTGITLLFSRLTLHKNSRLTKFLMVIGLLILLIAITMNMTRSTIIATAINMFLILLLYTKNNRTKIKKIVVLMLIPICFIFIGNYIVNSFDIYTRFQLNQSSSARIPMIITGIKYAFKNPLGTGIYNLASSSIELNYEPVIMNTILSNTTHNHLVNILVDYGFLGLIVAIKIYQIILLTFFKIKYFVNQELYVYLYSCFLCILGYSLNSMTHNAGLFDLDPLIWIIMSIFFVSFDLSNKEHYGSVNINAKN